MARRLTAERLREVLDYNPETGVFVWKIATSTRTKIGSVAGSSKSDKNGYIRVKIDRCQYRGHHLAWLHMTGDWPETWVDHRDLDEANNRWANLRLATPYQSAGNRSKNSTNKSGFKGVHFVKDTGKWCAQIAAGGKSRHIGVYDSPEKANAAYLERAELMYGEFARAA